MHRSPFSLNSFVAISVLACRPPSSHYAMAMGMDTGCSGEPRGVGPAGSFALFCAVFHWLHRGSGRNREFLFLTEEGTVAFKRVTKNKHSAVCPAHGGWKLSRAGSGMRLDIQRFHCTGWRQYVRDHTFMQVEPMGYAGEKLQFKDAANLRELTFVGLFWIEVPAQLALPRPRPAEWLALEEPADALAPPPAAALAPPPAEALAPPPAEALALASPPAADRLRPEDWEWEVLEAAARDEELAQHLMEEEGWVLAEPSAPFIPGVYQ